MHFFKKAGKDKAGSQLTTDLALKTMPKDHWLVAGQFLANILLTQIFEVGIRNRETGADQPLLRKPGITVSDKDGRIKEATHKHAAFTENAKTFVPYWLNIRHVLVRYGMENHIERGVGEHRKIAHITLLKPQR